MRPQLIADRALNPLAHGFFTRQGGVSSGIYASLNCGPGSGDAARAVAQNRARAAAALGLPAERLVTLQQSHSAICMIVEGPLAAPPPADAMATATPGLALGVLTADCMPVLLADRVAGVIGAAHAG